VLAAAIVLIAAVGTIAAEPSPTTAPDSSLQVGNIRVIVTDVYGDEELADAPGLVATVHRTMNALHPGTRGHVIRRELLVREGDVYDPDLVAETERNLRSLGFLTNVSVAAVDTLSGGLVPIEVRVQETWSLSTQVAYSRSSTSDRWTAMLTDGNFLGYGTKVEVGLGQDEDRDWQHLGFEDRRVLGSSLMLSLATIDLSDGYTHRLRLARPNYAQDDLWSWDVFLWDNAFAPRYYLSRGPDAADDSGRLYSSPTVNREGLDVSWMRRMSPEGRGRLWRVGAGVSTEHVSYELDGPVSTSDDVPLTPDEFRTAAGRALQRETGRTARVFLQVETLGREWTTDRFVRRYGVEEDILLDPYLWVRIGPALEALGADRERLLLESAAEDWSRLAGGWLLTRFSGRGAVGGHGDRWHVAGLMSGWHRRAVGGLNRVWVEGVVARDAPGPLTPVLGLTRGLRTLEYDGMVGDRLVRWNLEHARLVPGELLGFYTMAVAGFYSGGSAWWNDEPASRRKVRQELGVGVRFGPTRSSRAEIARLDLAWPLDGSSGPRLTAATGGFF